MLQWCRTLLMRSFSASFTCRSITHTNAPLHWPPLSPQICVLNSQSIQPATAGHSYTLGFTLSYTFPSCPALPEKPSLKLLTPLRVRTKDWRKNGQILNGPCHRACMSERTNIIKDPSCDSSCQRNLSCHRSTPEPVDRALQSSPWLISAGV